MSLLPALGASLQATGVELLVLLGPLALAVAALNLSSALLLRAAIGLLGRRAFLAAFGWLGTAVHELSHALFCVLFGHKITELKLFDPGAAGGSLGYVRHAYNPKNPYHQLGNLFIAIGPIVVGAAALTAAAILLLGGGELGAQPFAADGMAGGPSAAALAAQILGGAREIGARLTGGGHSSWLGAAGFLYLAIAIGSLMGMSREDFVGALPGLAAVVATLFLANLVSALVTGDTLERVAWSATRHLAVAYSVMIVAAAIDLAAAAVLFPISLVTRRS